MVKTETKTKSFRLLLIKVNLNQIKTFLKIVSRTQMLIIGIIKSVSLFVRKFDDSNI